MTSLSNVPHSSSTRADSDESPPSLVPLTPLLQRIVGASDPAFRSRLDERALVHEAELRQALFPVTRGYTYLNHAAVGPAPAPVAWATRAAFEAVSQRGSLAMEDRQPEDEVRQRFGRLINVAPESIAFTKNVSDSFMTIAQGLEWRPGDNIVTAAGEFPANVYPWLNLAEQGVETRFAPLVGDRLPLEQIAAQIDQRTRLVSLSFVEFGSGIRNDVAAIARLAHAVGALCAVDGIQGLGALRLDATAAEVDFLCAGSVKWLLSPAHLGLLYVRPSVLPSLRVARRGWRSVTTPFDFFSYDQPLRDDAGRLEGGGNSWLALVALDAALALLEAAGAEQIEARVLGLAQTTCTGLCERGYEITSPGAPAERSAIVTFRWGAERAQQEDAAAEAVARLTSEAQVVISARNGLLRVSPHFYNTDADIQRLLDSLDQARTQLL
ncbi:MAG TPA: aminotransferase class V-fold PLP-dependent enzyme [Ktedonobacterales bacterium]